MVAAVVARFVYPLNLRYPLNFAGPDELACLYDVRAWRCEFPQWVYFLRRQILYRDKFLRVDCPLMPVLAIAVISARVVVNLGVQIGFRYVFVQVKPIQ